MALITEEHEITDEKQVIRTFSLNSITLAFTKENKELETHFLVDFYNKSLDHVRLAIFAAIILYALYGIIDAALIPEFEHKFLTLRYLLVIPMLLSVLAFSFAKIYKRKIQFVNAMVVLISCLGVTGMIWLAPENLANYYFAGLILILVMNYGFLRLRFIWAVAAGILSSTAYIIAAFFIIQMPFLLAVVNSFFLIAINLIGFFIARYLEYYARRDYFTNQLLKIERVKLRTLNARLEAKIKDKANQLGNLQKEILDELENKGKV
ncbi:MAG: hypothetical protein P1P88_02600 [Bacteroidales bacterium]|nr:hypothetical protein [Bacteroidales bacterium]